MVARRAADARRPSARRRGYDAEWQRVRAEHLRAEPTCRACGARAGIVDHVVPIAEGGARGHGNLQSLCRSCHGRKTARDRRVGFAARVPKGPPLQTLP